MRKHSVTICGHQTSFSIEDEFYSELVAICERDGKSLASLVSQIDAQRKPGTNLSSAIRLHVLAAVKAR